MVDQKEAARLIGNFEQVFLRAKHSVDENNRPITAISMGAYNKAVDDLLAALTSPIPMILHCPKCGTQHIDAPDPAAGWDNPPHRSHKCQKCACIWRPADVSTCGVASVQTKGQADTWHPARSKCFARQFNDTMKCDFCNLTWDVNDFNPPRCKG